MVPVDACPDVTECRFRDTGFYPVRWNSAGGVLWPATLTGDTARWGPQNANDDVVLVYTPLSDLYLAHTDGGSEPRPGCVFPGPDGRGTSDSVAPHPVAPPRHMPGGLGQFHLFSQHLAQDVDVVYNSIQLLELIRSAGDAPQKGMPALGTVDRGSPLHSNA